MLSQLVIVRKRPNITLYYIYLVIHVKIFDPNLILQPNNVFNQKRDKQKLYWRCDG